MCAGEGRLEKFMSWAYAEHLSFCLVTFLDVTLPDVGNVVCDGSKSEL